jgi:hypothetical protein
VRAHAGTVATIGPRRITQMNYFLRLMPDFLERRKAEVRTTPLQELRFLRPRPNFGQCPFYPLRWIEARRRPMEFFASASSRADVSKRAALATKVL